MRRHLDAAVQTFKNFLPPAGDFNRASAIDYMARKARLSASEFTAYTDDSVIRTAEQLRHTDTPFKVRLAVSSVVAMVGIALLAPDNHGRLATFGAMLFGAAALSVFGKTHKAKTLFDQTISGIRHDIQWFKNQRFDPALNTATDLSLEQKDMVMHVMRNHGIDRVRRMTAQGALPEVEIHVNLNAVKDAPLTHLRRH